MKSLKLNPDITELYTLTEFINNIIGKNDMGVNLVVEEIFVNIVNYSKSDYVIINANFRNPELSIEFIDNGIPFDSTLKEDPEIPKTIDEAKIGGLGIYLTKKMTDKITYQYLNDENHLKIIKTVK